MKNDWAKLSKTQAVIIQFLTGAEEFSVGSIQMSLRADKNQPRTQLITGNYAAIKKKKTK